MASKREPSYSTNRSWGALIGGASCRVFPFEHQLTTFPHLEKWDIMLRFFIWNTYSQHCPMFKNVVAWRVPEHLLPTFPYDKKCDIVPRLFHFQIYSRVFIFSTSPDVIPLCSILHMHISRSIFQTDRKLSARDSARVFLVGIYQPAAFVCRRVAWTNSVLQN